MVMLCWLVPRYIYSTALITASRSAKDRLFLLLITGSMVFRVILFYYFDMAFIKFNNRFKSQPIWQQYAIVLVFNSLIALFLHSIMQNSNFSNQLFLSQCIGLSILTSYLGLAQLIELKGWRVLIPLLPGSLIGISIAVFIQALRLNASLDIVWESLRQHYANILTMLFIALFFGGIIIAFFIYRENMHQHRTRLQAEQISNLDHQKTIVETNLRMLQAQIEPHFLFNTLSNVISLIEKEPVKSKHLLESLTEFLRASLKRSSEQGQDLDNEINLIQYYLEIMKTRIGKRLDYTIQKQPEVGNCKFPPLLLQPLVENAIIHGIEPVREGGRIDINIAREADNLILTVSDTGKGLSGNSIKGFGLSNIRDRIRSIYLDQGHLMIEENQPSGVTASIEIPYEPV